MGIAARDEEGGSQVCCTLMIKYEGKEGTRFPDLAIRIGTCDNYTNRGEFAIIGSNPFESPKFGETSWKHAIYQIVTSTDIYLP